MTGVARRNGYYVDSFIKKFDECKDAGYTREATKAIMNEYALTEIRQVMEEGNRPLEIKKDIVEILRMLDQAIMYCVRHL